VAAAADGGCGAAAVTQRWLQRLDDRRWSGCSDSTADGGAAAAAGGGAAAATRWRSCSDPARWRWRRPGGGGGSARRRRRRPRGGGGSARRRRRRPVGGSGSAKQKQKKNGSNYHVRGEELDACIDV
jgi:hypothetical protein